MEEPLHEMAEQVVAMIDQLTMGQAITKRNIMLPVRLIDRNSVQ